MSANEIQNAMSANQQNNTNHNINIKPQLRAAVYKTELPSTVHTALEQQNVAKNCRISITSSSENLQQQHTQHFKKVLSAYTLAHDLAQLKELKPAASAVEKVLNWRWQSVVSPVEDVHVFENLFEQREANVDKLRLNHLNSNMSGNQSQYNYAQFQKYMQQHHAQPIELKHLRRSSRCISKPFKYEETAPLSNVVAAKNVVKETTRKRANLNITAEPQAKRKVTQPIAVSSQKVIKKIITPPQKLEMKKIKEEVSPKITTTKTTVKADKLLTKKPSAASNLIVLRQDFTTKNLQLGEKRAQLFDINQMPEKANATVLQPPPPPPPISFLHAKPVNPLHIKIEKNNNTLVKSATTTTKSTVSESPASSSGFHQQHVFCNYLGLTGMSTATAVANAVAELANSTTTRRSLRVRNLQQKLKQQSQNTLKPSNVNKKPTVGCQMKIFDDKSHSEKPNSNSPDGQFSVPRMHKMNSINPENGPAIRIVYRFSSISQEKEEPKASNIFIPPKLKTLQELLPKRRLITSMKNITIENKRTQSNQTQPIPAVVNDCSLISKQINRNCETAKPLTSCNEEKEETNHVAHTTSNFDVEYSAPVAIQEEHTTKQIIMPDFTTASVEDSKAIASNDEKEQIIEHSNLCYNEKIMKKEEKQNSTTTEEIEVVNLIADEMDEAITSNHLCNVAKVNNINNETSETAYQEIAEEVDKNDHIKQNGRLLPSASQQEDIKHNTEEENHESATIIINRTKLPILNTTFSNKHKLSFTEFENQYAQHVVANGLVEPHNIQELSKTAVTPNVAEHIMNDVSEIKTAEVDVAQQQVNVAIAIATSSSKNDDKECLFANVETAASIPELESHIKSQALSNNSVMNELAETEAEEKLNGISHEILNVPEHKADIEVTIEDSNTELINYDASEVVQEEPCNNFAIEDVKELKNNTPAKDMQEYEQNVNSEIIEEIVEKDLCNNDATEVEQNLACDVVQQSLSNNIAVETIQPELRHNVAIQVVEEELGNNGVEEEDISTEINLSVANIPAGENNKILAESNTIKSKDLSSSVANIRYLSKSCVTPQKNPLKEEFGSVLYIYYELDVLIVVQDLLISFWKYPKLLNVLKMAAGDEVHNDGGEWLPLDQCRRLTNDIEISAAYTSRLCFNNSIPVYVEMRGRHRPPDMGRINDLLSLYINVYYYHDEEMQGKLHSIDLDIVQSLPIEVTYTTISESRYFVMCWPQIVLGKRKKTGMCKYSLTPQLDTLASIREFKDLRHHVLLLECANDDKLLGFGETQLTIWDHRSGDVLMNYDFELTLGRNVGSIYYHRPELDQNNMLLLFQLVSSPNDNQHELVLLLCSVSHVTPTHRILKRLVMPSPAFSAGVRSADNIGENLVLTAQETNVELWISCSDPNTMLILPSQSSQRYYARARTQVIELTEHTLTVDTLSNHLLKLNANSNDDLSF